MDTAVSSVALSFRLRPYENARLPTSNAPRRKNTSAATSSIEITASSSRVVALRSVQVPTSSAVKPKKWLQSLCVEFWSVFLLQQGFLSKAQGLGLSAIPLP